MSRIATFGGSFRPTAATDEEKNWPRSILFFIACFLILASFGLIIAYRVLNPNTVNKIMNRTDLDKEVTKTGKDLFTIVEELRKKEEPEPLADGTEPEHEIWDLTCTCKKSSVKVSQLMVDNSNDEKTDFNPPPTFNRTFGRQADACAAANQNNLVSELCGITDQKFRVAWDKLRLSVPTFPHKDEMTDVFEEEFVEMCDTFVYDIENLIGQLNVIFEEVGVNVTHFEDGGHISMYDMKIESWIKCFEDPIIMNEDYAAYEPGGLDGLYKNLFARCNVERCTWTEPETAFNMFLWVLAVGGQVQGYLLLFFAFTYGCFFAGCATANNDAETNSGAQMQAMDNSGIDGGVPVAASKPKSPRKKKSRSTSPTRSPRKKEEAAVEDDEVLKVDDDE